MIASGVVGPPTVGQEGPEIFTGNLWQQCRKSRQNVAQVGERFDLVPGAGSDQAVVNRGRTPASFAAAKEPIAAADGQTAQSPLGCQVVDRQAAVRSVADQRRPLIQRVVHRLAHGMFRQQLGRFAFQPCVKLLQDR